MNDWKSVNINPFKKEIANSDASRVESILNEFDLIRIDRPVPSSIEELVIEMKKHTSWGGQEYSDLVEISNAVLFNALEGEDVSNGMVRTLIYAFGVNIYRLAIAKKLPIEAINSARMYLEIAIKLDPEYYQAYNSLGDTWIWVQEGVEETIGCYKAALKFHGKGKNSTAIFQNSGDDAIKGDNYFKIGMCLARLNRINDAVLFVTFAQQFLDEEDDIYTDFGFKNWASVYDFIEFKKNDRIQIENFEQEVSIGIEFKRKGKYKEAVSIYTQLNDKYPNNPVIFKSWAKVLVCLGQYENAITKYNSAIKYFDKEGKEGESWQCNDQIDEINNRTNDPIRFRQWVSAISGGSISPTD